MQTYSFPVNTSVLLTIIMHSRPFSVPRGCKHRPLLLGTAAINSHNSLSFYCLLLCVCIEEGLSATADAECFKHTNKSPLSLSPSHILPQLKPTHSFVMRRKRGSRSQSRLVWSCRLNISKSVMTPLSLLRGKNNRMEEFFFFSFFRQLHNSRIADAKATDKNMPIKVVLADIGIYFN